MICFPYLLFNGDTTWTNPAVKDLKLLDEKFRKHWNSAKQINSVILLACIRDSQHCVTAKQGLQTTKTQILQESEKTPTSHLQVIHSIKFCGKFLIPVCGHDGTWNSPKPGVFRGFLEFVESWRNPWNPIYWTPNILGDTQKLYKINFRLHPQGMPRWNAYWNETW